MRNPLAIATLFVASAVLSGCDKAPLETVETNNPNIDLDIMIEKNGCEISRFKDGGRNVHITLCPDAGVSMSQYYYSVSCGKNCTTTKLRQQIQSRSPYQNLER